MRLTPEQLSARKRRNLAIAGGLVLFVVLVFTTTMLNLKRNIEADMQAMPAAAAAR